MDIMKIINSVAGGAAGNSLSGLKNLLASQLNQAPGAQPAGTHTDSAVAGVSLLFQTLYAVLLEKGVFTHEEFTKKFDELDLRDGIKDGK